MEIPRQKRRKRRARDGEIAATVFFFLVEHGVFFFLCTHYGTLVADGLSSFHRKREAASVDGPVRAVACALLDRVDNAFSSKRAEKWSSQLGLSIFRRMDK